MEEIYKYHHRLRNTEHLVWKNRRLKYFRNKIKGKKKMLDVGCRDGKFSSLLKQDTFGIDIDSEALSKCPFQTQQVDLNCEWGLFTKFDVILMTEVLEHLYFPKEVVMKVRSYLKDGGLFVGSVPNAYTVKSKLRFICNSKKHTSLEDETHINHFSEKELKTLLETIFTNVEVKKTGQILLFSCNN